MKHKYKYRKRKLEERHFNRPTLNIVNFWSLHMTFLDFGTLVYLSLPRDGVLLYDC